MRTPEMCANLGKYKRTPEIRAKISAGVTPSARANARDPEWRRKVSEATKARMHEPEIRERHLAGLANAERDFPFAAGGNGTPPNALEASYGWLLDLGYVNDFPIAVGGRTYRLDYALIEAKVAIEIDGNSHRSVDRQQSDCLKDKQLKTLGWVIIRVRHWR